MEFLSLMDSSTVSGTKEEELKSVLKDIDARREFIPVKVNDMTFTVVNGVDSGVPVGIVIPEKTVEAKDGEEIISKSYESQFMDYIENLPTDLAIEAIDCAVFMTVKSDRKEKELPMSVRAVEDLMGFVGLHGPATERRTPELMQLVYELLKNQMPKVIYNNNNTATLDPYGNTVVKNYKYRGIVPKCYDMTLSILRDHENPEIKKIFSCRSGKYTKIEQQNVLDIIERADLLGKGKPEVLRWKVTQQLTEVIAGFMEVADEFSTEFEMKAKIIPCFRILTSDTGDSSLRIEKYLMFERNGNEACLRLPEVNGEKASVLTRHCGDNMSDRVIDLIFRTNTELFKTFREFPEKLAGLMAKGKADTYETVRTSFEAMRLQKGAVIINKEIEEKIIEALVENMPKRQDILDTVYAVLFVADNPDIDFITENQREELRRKALLAVFGDFDAMRSCITPAVPAPGIAV